MTWEFHVVATAQQRLFSRIRQILEGQMVIIRSFNREINDKEVFVTFHFSSEQDKGYRIEALLYRVEGVRHVSQSTVE